jgi:hypothetical protein
VVQSGFRLTLEGVVRCELDDVQHCCPPDAVHTDGQEPANAEDFASDSEECRRCRGGHFVFRSAGDSSGRVRELAWDRSGDGTGGFAVLGNLLSGHLGDQWKQRLSDRMADPLTVLRNHDLLQLSGDAAQLVLLAEAESATSTSSRDGELPAQDFIREITNTLAAEWNDLADTPGWRDELLELSREGVVDWMRQNGVDWSRGSSMSVEFWKSLLRPLAVKVALASTDSVIDQDRIRAQAGGLIDDLAQVLVEKYATSVRELLKQDAGKKGEAFAGLVLILHAETLKSLSEIADGQESLADVLQTRGELDEALRIRREEELPVYERLGATRDLLVCRWWIATYLLVRDAPGDRDEAAELLRQAHAAAEKMGIPEAGQIREVQEDEGLEF